MASLNVKRGDIFYADLSPVVGSEEYGLNRDSVVLLEQIRTLDKKRLKEKIGHMTEEDMKKVNKSLLISLNLQ